MNFESKYLAEFKNLHTKFVTCKEKEVAMRLRKEKKRTFVEWEYAIHACMDDILHLNKEYQKRNFIRLETAFAFLAIDIQLFRTGYVRERMCEFLKNAHLTREQQDVLQSILLKKFQTAGRDFKRLVKLFRLLDKETIIPILEKFDSANKAFIKERVDYILSYLKSN